MTTTWQDVPHIDAGFIDRINWTQSELCGEYAEYSLQFENFDVVDAHFSLTRHDDWFWIRYLHCGLDPANPIETETTIDLVQEVDRYGRERSKMSCPKCTLLTRRLVLMPYGLRCGRCASVTSPELSIGDIKQAIRAAQKVSNQLNSPNWRVPPQDRPHRMRKTTYSKLKQRRAILAAEINRLAYGEQIAGTA
jgi:hypothetical protein